MRRIGLISCEEGVLIAVSGQGCLSILVSLSDGDLMVDVGLRKSIQGKYRGLLNIQLSCGNRYPEYVTLLQKIVRVYRLMH
jgi:hypothetical protein